MSVNTFPITAPGEFMTDLVVQEARAVADDVVALTLVDTDGAELPAWQPGAHIDLVVDEEVTRQYSLCGDPDDRARWRVAVLRTDGPRGHSRLISGTLVGGTSVRVRGPRNNFPLVAAPQYLFIAGGIGITSLLPMVRQVERTGSTWKLVYTGRRRSTMAFIDELESFADKVDVVPGDERGRLDVLSVLGQPRPGTAVHACGPQGLLLAVEVATETWPTGSVHVERFGASTQPQLAAHPFSVVLERSGITVEMPSDKTVFEAVEQAGVTALGSCLEGVCGTCETGVIDGEVDHRDSVPSDEERRSNAIMMICVSRCKGSRLVVDLETEPDSSPGGTIGER